MVLTLLVVLMLVGPIGAQRLSPHVAPGVPYAPLPLRYYGCGLLASLPCLTISSGARILERTSSRPTWLFDAAAAGVLVTVALLSLLGVSAFSAIDPEPLLRNTAFLAGVGLTASAWAGPAGALIPVAWAALAAFRRGIPLPLFVLGDEPSPANWLLSGLALVLGLAAVAARQARRTSLP